MLRIEVGPDDLAASRFALGPMSELEYLLRKLDQRGGRTASGLSMRTTRWARRYAPVRDDLDARTLRALRPTGWGVDLLAPPPTGMTRTLAEDLALVRGTPRALARLQIERALAATGPVDAQVRTVLHRRDVTDWLAGALERMWKLLVAPDWPHLRAIAEQDVLHRAERLARDGWAGALTGLHPSLRWQDGMVTVGHLPDATVRLDGRGLVFVPSVFLHPRLSTLFEAPWQPTIVYPARGSAALWERGAAAFPTPGSLARLLGPTRADLLLRLDTPASTTQLAHSTGVALGAVGDHLRVLRDAGLAQSARAGRSVIYRRTPVGDAVVAGGS